jgi:histidine triad (HIT) family protein
MSNCIFCNIVEGEIPCARVWEDENFLAFLDIRPVTKGMTLVIPKKHHQSYIFNETDWDISALLKASRKVAKMLEEAFDISRVAVVAEGAGVNHLHIKLYPLHGFDENFNANFPKESIYFDNYPGYISTQLGPENTPSQLQELADFIKKQGNLNL